MPRLPDYTALGERPTPRAGLGRTSYQPTSGKEGAIGQALSGLGNTLAQVSDEIEKENIRVDTLRAEDAFNKLREKQMLLAKGDDGFLNKRGGDAVNNDLLGDYGKRFDTATKEIVDSLGNDRQKALLRRRADIAGLEFKQDMLSHVTREKESYEDQTFKGIIDTETSNAIERYKDQNGTALSLERINAAISAMASRKGLAPEAVQAMRRDASSRVNRGIIERHLANEDDLSATAKYETIKGTLNGEDAIAVEKALDIGSTRGQAQRFADKFMAKHDNNFGLAIEEAKKITHPKVREATLANIRTAKSDNEASIKLNEDEAFTAALQTIQKYGDVQKVNPSEWVRIGPDGHAALEKMAAEVKENRTPTTDQKVWNEFNSKSTDRRWLAGLTEKEFTSYLMGFDEEKRDRASALRDAAVAAAKGDPKAKDLLRNDATLRQLVLTKVIDSGLIDAKKKTADYTQEDETVLNNTVAEASSQLERLQIESGRKATVDEERAIVNGLLMKQLKVKVERPWYLPDAKKKISELTSGEIDKAYIEYKSVPIEKRDAIRRMAAELGIKTEDLSEDRIAKAYTVYTLTKGLPRSAREARIAAILRGE